MPYADLREYLAALEERDLLHHVRCEVDKDWEIAAVCRRVFQRVPPDGRRALIFDRVRGFDVPVAVGLVGASRHVYATALQTTPEGIGACWDRALAAPIAPRRVDASPVKERVWKGEDADVTRIPVPVWTVGEDPGPYITAPFVVTRDPDTGWTNVGTYRVQIKGPRHIGVNSGRGHHGLSHFRKYAQRGEPCPVAIVLGGDPTVALVSVTSVPETVEELSVAGGLRGEALPVVRCETVDLLVPAGAEYVIEGYVRTDGLEMEGPFGEYTGYMGLAEPNYFMDVTCITHRADPIYQAYFSQMPPSESSLIRQVGRERPIHHHLRNVLGLPVTGVCLREAGGATAWLVIALRKRTEDQPRQAIWGAWAAEPSLGKFTVVVDDDIDPRDDFMVDWAISFRCQPQRDVYLERDTAPMRLDPSVDGFGREGYSKYRARGSKLGIDATIKHPYPAKSMPPAEHLARVDGRWAEYGFQPGVAPAPRGAEAEPAIR